MSVTVYSEIIYPTYAKRRYEVILTDNLGAEHKHVSNSNDYPLSDDGSSTEASRLQSVKDQEIQSWINQMEAGEDPWHIGHDNDTWFTNSVPLWNTWDEASSLSLRNFLLSDYKPDLLNTEVSSFRTSNKDLDDVLLLAGSTWGEGDLRSAIQQAVILQAELDTYIPSVVEIE